MASILGFGAYVPERVLTNEELASRLGIEANWILQVSGIRERRIADSDSVAALGVAAARRCLDKCATPPDQVGIVLVASGSADRRFPGPAVEVGLALGISGVPCLDLPLASAGGLIGIILASRLAETYGTVLVVAAEKMSAVTLTEPLNKNIAILFGDGAGACVVTREGPGIRILESVWHSAGEFVDQLTLPHIGPLEMDGPAVIMQASRKIPAAIEEVLRRQNQSPESIHQFILHQANQNLINRIAKALGVDSARFFSNIALYGNTSSASMLIAASEFFERPQQPGSLICFGSFGAGYQWGAILAKLVS